MTATKRGLEQSRVWGLQKVLDMKDPVDELRK